MTSPLNPLSMSLVTIQYVYVHTFNIENASLHKGLATWWYTANKSCFSCVYSALQGYFLMSSVQIHYWSARYDWASADVLTFMPFFKPRTVFDSES